MPAPLRAFCRLPLLLLCLLGSLPTRAQSLQSAFSHPVPRQLDSLRRVMQQRQHRLTQDPTLGRVPSERLDAIQQQLTTSKQGARADAAPMTWTERGPQGVTGTIRALLIDPLDTSKRKVWAGSNVAGLWVNNDITSPDSKWQCVSDDWNNRAVSSVAADPSNAQIRYAATGDLFDDVNGPIGNGIWKSSNGGTSWSKLSSTVPVVGGTALQTAFLRVSKVLVGTGGVVFAATQAGVVRSADGGASWQFTLAPGQNIGGQPVSGTDDRMSDLEQASDGLLYAATHNGRIFRSTTTGGTAWTEITPTGTTPYNGVRTEIALGTSTTGSQQVIYAVSVAYNNNTGGYISRWLRRSANGGQTWATLPKPVHSSYPDYDFTLGFGDTYLTLNVAADNANSVYLSAYDQLYSSTNAGQSWTTGAPVDKTTVLLPINNQRVVWGGEVKIRHASQLTSVIQQGTNDALYDRSNGFGGLAATGLAMRNMVGSAYRLVGSSGEPGLLEMPTPSGGANAGQVTYAAYPLRPFIDQDTPGLQLATTPSDGFLWRNTGQSPSWNYASTSLTTGNTALSDFADYDSRTHTLYYWAGNYVMATFQPSGTTVAAPTFKVLSTNLTQPSVIKAGAVANTLFIATVDTKLYRLTGTNVSSVTITAIDQNAFPTGSTISSIDVGATNNELIVTLFNYGVKSVWYTSNGGTTWTSKDEVISGLPDVPVYDVLMNPANRKQVMLATELGIWSTDDITLSTPTWSLSSASLPLMRSVQLIYRPADGLVGAAIAGRGVWETNAWATSSPASPTLVAGTLSQTALCAGSSLPVSFTLQNGNGASVEARLSDAQGNFTNSTLIGSSTSSPLTLTIPTGTAAGSGYRLRLFVADLGLTATLSQTLTVSNLTNRTAYLADRRNLADSRLKDVRYTEGYTCPGDAATLYAVISGSPLSASATYRWAADGVEVTSARSATLSTSQTGTYSFTATEFGCSISYTDGFLLKAIDNPLPTIINPVPDNGPVCLGKTSPLVAGYLGKQGTYQWYKDEVAISGATSAIYPAGQTGAYSLRVGMGSCAATAPPVVLTFSRSILSSPIAVVGDVPPTLCGSNTVQLYASQQPDSTAYQWLKNGQPMTGQTDPNLTVAQEGIYSLRISRDGCQAVSGPLSVSTSDQLSTGFYYYGSTSACTGETLTLYAKRYDQSLQWMRNGVDIPGATDLLYQASTSGDYTLRATAGGCSATAVAVSLGFSQNIVPQLVTNERCSSVDLSTQDYPRTGNTSFYWLKNGQVVTQNTQAYQTVYESGTYSLSVSNGTCSGVSRPVTLQIGQPSAPQIQANGRTLRCPNSAVDLQVVKGSYSGWKRNGVLIPNTNTYHFAATESGVYTVAYQDETCTTESNAVTVTFSDPASATMTGKALIQVGQSATLAVGLSGVSPWSLSLSNGQTVFNTTQSPYVFSVAPSSSTSYSVVSVSNSCGTGTVSGVGRIYLGGADVSLSSWVDRKMVGTNGIVVQTVRVYNAGPEPAEGIILTNRLPATTSYTTSGTATTMSSLSVGTLAMGQAASYSFSVQNSQAGTFVNAIEVSACDTPDPDSTPGTGTADGEDDATQADWRVTTSRNVIDTTRFVAISPNPNGRILPAVASNQPPVVANKADLALQIWTNSRVATANQDTIRVTVQVRNKGGLTASGVRSSLVMPNGSFSTDGENWFSVGGSASLSLNLGQVLANQSASRTIFWVPANNGQLSGEILTSSVLDPNSTPNNRSTRPGEDDEATADVRVR